MFGDYFRIQDDLLCVVLLHDSCAIFSILIISDYVKMFEEYLPVLKLTTMSIRKIVSLRQLNAIHLVLRSSLKNDMATGKMIKLATSSNNIHKSQ